MDFTPLLNQVQKNDCRVVSLFVGLAILVVRRVGVGNVGLIEGLG